MNQYVTGAAIKELREKAGLTQAELSEKLCISDKTVSKWETGKGFPDISLLEPLSKLFGVSVAELLSGNTVKNTNVSGNMIRTRFYVCPVCGNIIHSVGNALISCHGITLVPITAEVPDETHCISVENVEDEYFVSVSHEMTKSHYISFFAAISDNRVQIVKTYPEGNAEARFKRGMVSKILFYCNKDGLFELKIS